MAQFLNTTEEIKTIFWDFDGVLMDSMAVRDKGFEVVLSDHPKEQVSELLDFHQKNGGLSRYVKFRYFFEEIKKKQISDEEVIFFAQKFSEVMLANLLDETLLIAETVEFIKNNYKKYKMHIVSGSDQNELRQICHGLDIDKFFSSIHGSPIPKKELVRNLLERHGYDLEATILIGDSINDYEAAVENGITFFGYNNLKLREEGKNYIESFRI